YESERSAISLLPFRQMRQEQFDVLFVPYEVIIDNENGSTPAGLLKHFKLRDHLLVAFCPWQPSVNLDNVAKLAVERTSARVLNRHSAVSLHIGEFKIRYWCKCELRSIRRVVNRFCFAMLQILNKLWQELLSFTKNNVIRTS